ncbi:hypothetical protein [Priestia megaterium]|uniref:hypothetical protein n=1 Tax=Priestia megaterium TaxID=1404 RepID=UPI002877C003|nr:hypothetical protein [Priestia megaterium]MBX4161654.1 hypothetical protein [Priestia megaterium]
MNNIPIGYTHCRVEIANRLNLLIEAVGYKIKDVNKQELDFEKINQYHFLMGIYTDLNILNEQVTTYCTNAERKLCDE